MIVEYPFESLMMTNTVVVALCIVLLLLSLGLIVFFIIPLIRRRWPKNSLDNDPRKLNEISALTRQPSFHHLALSPSGLNPFVHSPSDHLPSNTTTQFGTLFHSHGSTPAFLHPTLWTPIAPAGTASLFSPVASSQSTPARPLKSHPSTPASRHSPKPIRSMKHR